MTDDKSLLARAPAPAAAFTMNGRRPPPRPPTPSATAALLRLLLTRRAMLLASVAIAVALGIAQRAGLIFTQDATPLWCASLARSRAPPEHAAAIRGDPEFVHRWSRVKPADLDSLQQHSLWERAGQAWAWLRAYVLARSLSSIDKLDDFAHLREEGAPRGIEEFLMFGEELGDTTHGRGDREEMTGTRCAASSYATGGCGRRVSQSGWRRRRPWRWHIQWSSKHSLTHSPTYPSTHPPTHSLPLSVTYFCGSASAAVGAMTHPVAGVDFLEAALTAARAQLPAAQAILQVSLDDSADRHLGHIWTMHVLPNASVQIYQSFIRHYSLGEWLARSPPLGEAGIAALLSRLRALEGASPAPRPWTDAMEAAYFDAFGVALASVGVGRGGTGMRTRKTQAGNVTVGIFVACVLAPWNGTQADERDADWQEWDEALTDPHGRAARIVTREAHGCGDGGASARGWAADQAPPRGRRRREE